MAAFLRTRTASSAEDTIPVEEFSVAEMTRALVSLKDEVTTLQAPSHMPFQLSDSVAL